MTKNPKKVCLVTISLAQGGVERSVAMLSEMLSQWGHEVHIITLNDRIEYEFQGQLFNLGKFKTTPDNGLKRLLRFLKMRNYLVKNRFDFIIDHRPKMNMRKERFYHQYLYRGFRKIYVVHSSHGQLYATDTPEKAQLIYQKNFATVAVSEYIHQQLIRQGVTNSLTIYNAVNPDWPKKQQPLPEPLRGKEYLLAYGRMDDSVKDFSFLIQAFSVSKLWQREIYLVLMGDGPDKAMLQEKAKQVPGGEWIVFLPFMNPPFTVVSNSRFVTLTSRFEGFPMVVVESLSMGVPVVSLDIVSGPSEVVKHQQNGWLVSQRDTSEFAQAMQAMFDDLDLYQRCKAQAQDSVAHLTQAHIAQQWHQLISI